MPAGYSELASHAISLSLCLLAVPKNASFFFTTLLAEKSDKNVKADIVAYKKLKLSLVHDSFQNNQCEIDGVPSWCLSSFFFFLLAAFALPLSVYL